MSTLMSDTFDNELYNRFMQFAQAMQQGETIGDTLDITPRECEALYTIGHTLYGQARYSEAFRIFSLLVMFNHLDDRYLMALASAAQSLGRYKDALHNYAAVALMRLDDPAPLFHSAECLIALSHFDEAIETLELILDIDADVNSKNVYTRRARALLPLLRQRAPQHNTRPSGEN